MRVREILYLGTFLKSQCGVCDMADVRIHNDGHYIANCYGHNCYAIAEFIKLTKERK